MTGTWSSRPARGSSEASVLVEGPWSHRYISANGSRFHVVEAGTGPLVLFLHGFPEFWWAWHHQLRVVADTGFRAVAGRFGLVDLDTPVDALAGRIAALRIFAGYAGWGAGQLEEEVAEGAWYVVPSEAGDLCREDPSDLWRDVLRRQPGELAWHSTRPADPDLN